MKKITKLIFIIMGLFVTLQCTESTWKEVAEIYCNLYADCLHGVGNFDLDAVGSCACDCEDDWCGPRCEMQKSYCENNGGTISFERDPWDDQYYCQCNCPPPFTNPPHCNTILIPFRPKSSDPSFKGIQENNKGKASQDYFPLAKSNIWVFDVLDDDGNKDSEFGFRIRSSFSYEDVMYYDCQFLTADTITGLIIDGTAMIGPLLYNLPEDPNQIAQRVNDTTTVLYFLHDYIDGDTILIDGDTAFVEQIGTVSFPSGSYDDCFSVLDTSGTGNIFAPNVGWIAFLTGNDTTAVLASVELGCSIGAEISVSNSSCFGANDGAINIEVNGDPLGLTFIWDGPTSIPDEQNPSNLSAGLYYLTVSNENCTANVDSILVSEPRQIEIVLDSITHISCYGDSTGAIDISVSGGSGNLEMNWNEGAFDSQDISNLVAGCYTLVVIDTLGCTHEFTVDILEPDSLVTEVSSFEDVSCYEGTDGMITLDITGGTSGYSVLWEGGETTATIGMLSAGIYRATVTDSEGCEVIVEKTIVEPDELVSTVSSFEDVSCYEGTDGMITLDITGGTSGYSVLWEGGERTATIGMLSAGIYRATVTDSEGCEVIVEKTIVEPDELVSTVSSFEDVSCYEGTDGMITLDITGGTSGYSVLWEGGETTATIGMLSAGIYRATVTDSEGCEVIVEKTIVEPDELVSTVSSFEDVSCYEGTDGMITLDITGGTSGYSVLWEGGETTATIGMLSAGIYRATVTDSEGCEVIVEKTIVEPDELVSTVSSFEDVSCYEGTDGMITLDITGGTSGYSVLWEGGETTATIGMLSAGIYRATVTDSEGCEVIVEKTIVEPDELVSTVSSFEDVSCYEGTDGSIEIDITGGTSGYSVLWEGGETTATIGMLSAGIYRATVTDSEGCEAYVEQTIVEPDELVSTVSSFEDVSCYEGTDGMITLDITGGTSGYSVLWEGGETTATIGMLSAGIYRATVTDSEGCEVIVEKTIVEPDELVSTVSSFEDVSCYEGTDGSIEIDITGGTSGYSVLWEGGERTATIGMLSAGIYRATVTDSEGCEAYVEQTIVEPDSIELQFETTSATSGNADGTATVLVTGGIPGYDFVWDDSNAHTTSTITGLFSGEYTVTVTDQNGCTKTGKIVVGISTSTKEVFLNDLVLYPNPVNETIYLKNSNGKIEVDSYEVLDQTGKVLFKSPKLNADHTIELRKLGLSSGIYILRLMNKNKSKYFMFVVT